MDHPASAFREIHRAGLQTNGFTKQAKIGAATLQNILKSKPVKRYIAERMCDAMGVSMTRGFREKDEKTTLYNRTVQHYHRLLSSILNTAIVWQIIPDNPAKRVKPPKAPRREAKCLDEQQVAQLLDNLKDEPIKYQTIVKLLVYSGMRRGELCGLEMIYYCYNFIICNSFRWIFVPEPIRKCSIKYQMNPLAILMH